MDDFQIIIESPQQRNASKKRPRLVTACDSCRVRKIKCVRPVSDSTCEACSEANVPCHFYDRERYFEERGRSITAIPTRSSTHADGAVPQPHPGFRPEGKAARPASSLGSHPAVTSRPVLSESEQNIRYRTYPPDAISRNAGLPGSPYAYYGQDAFGSAVPASFRPYSHSQTPTPPLHHSGHMTLFDPRLPQYPNPELMPIFIQLFFQKMGSEFPFMSHEETMGRFYDRTLSAALANCIAALAVRFSDIRDLTSIDSQMAADRYEENAKIIISTTFLVPDFDILHALVLLSWLERKNRRASSFQTYCQMAMAMAQQLSLTSGEGVKQHKLRATWTSLLPLHNMATTGQ